jgi:hypothetical protein
VTSDAERSRLYIDGVECQPLASTVPFNAAKTGQPLVLGASSPQGNEQLPCALDEVAIYSRVLAAADIARYADEAMTGFEYSAAATMIQAGMLTEGCLVAKAVADRYDGRLRKGVQCWGYNGNPFGDDECGRFYARAMSSWSLLLACQGFVYDGPAGLIGFRPRWQPADHVSFFTAAAGYGLFTQQREGGTQSERIELKHGTLTVTRLVFEVAPPTQPATVAVSAAGQPVKAAFTARDGRVSITLEAAVTLREGETLEAVLK